MTLPGASAKIEPVMVNSPANDCLVLMTDFGTQDTYVGVMKGVIAEISPSTTVIDLSHSIPQGDLQQAAYKLWQSVSYFPAGTIFVVVVDPGVGTERRAVGIEWEDYFFIAPDNGVLSYLTALAPFKAAKGLTNSKFHLKPVSSTFHGRDIFAPAGAHLAAGVSLAEFGEDLASLVQLQLPRLVQTRSGALEGEVIHIDGFGNAITSIGRLKQQQGGMVLEPWLGQQPAMELPPIGRIDLPSGVILPLSSTFGAVALGEPVAYLGSEQLLELAINGGSAAVELELTRGAPIKLNFRG